MANPSKKFYTICKPITENENTGNLCININDLMKFNKDFIYDGLVVSKEVVKDNLKTMFITKEDQYGRITKIPIYFIKKEIVYEFGEAA